MNTRRCRRFDLVDAVIAVATIALVMPMLPANPPALLRRAWSTARWPTAVAALMIANWLVAPWLGWTVAYLGYRARQPRPPLRRVRRQAGFVAAVVASILASVQLALAIQGPSGHRLGNHLLELVAGISPGVIGAWSALWMTGRYQTEPGWIDRLGRTLGWGWIILYVLQQVDSRLFPLLLR